MEKDKDLDFDYYQRGIENDLKIVNVDWNSRLFPDKIAEALDKLVERNKFKTSSYFNRIVFSHILDFKGLGKSDSPILVSDFFHSYFQVYESMRKNRDDFGKSCIEITNRISEFKSQVQIAKQTERILENGQTNNSRVKVDMKDVYIGEDDDLNTAFKGYKLIFEYLDNLDNPNNKQLTPQDSLVLKEIQLNKGGFENNYQFAITNINRKICVTLENNQGKKTIDTFTPSEYFNIIIEKEYNVADKGRFVIDIGYIDSNVTFINKLIVESEQQYEENHVHFDNLENSIGLLEEPFKDFMDRHNQDPERQLSQEVNPNKDSTTKKGGYISELHRKEIEVSEKVENMILNISGKKCIVWETIYFLINKIMLGFVIFVMLYRADYATVRIIFY